MSFEKKIPSDDTLKKGLESIANAIYRLDDNYKIGKTLGGIEIKAKASTGTLIGDYAGLSKEELMTKYPFNKLYIEDVDSFNSDGTATNVKDSYLVMPNCWRYDEYSADGTEIHWIANYKVNDSFYKAYDGDFTELLLGVYKASLKEGDSLLHSVSGVVPKTSFNQSEENNAMPYYKTGKGMRRAEYQDYRVRGLYNILAIIYLGTRDSQSVYRGICDYAWNTGTYTDILDTDSQKTGVTEQSTSTGYMSHGVVSGEITGTSTTASLDVGKRPFKLLGVENPYGAFWENLYGLVHKNEEVYAYKGSDPIPTDKLAPSDSNTIYTDLNIKMPTDAGNQGAQQNANGFNVPLNLDGNGSTYNGDYYWYSNGWNIALVGGYWYDGSHDGLFYLLVNSGFGYYAANVGFRLSFER